jgi:dihydrofolate synthase / folylpolyglutamate synthase
MNRTSQTPRRSARRSDPCWTYEEAEGYLLSLEPLGWRFGLDRIRRLVTVLGMPQHRFASIHVVGTNGKSSVAEMTAALLEAHGRRAGAYLSPHVDRWSERVRVGGAEIGGDEFGAAVERVAQSVEVVNRSLDEGESVTQFEAATAAAFVALAAARVEFGVIEAGLGGRLDATNVLPSRTTALTSVGLEHTEWLGETEEEIAAEKLAVLRDHTTLVIGEVGAGVRQLAERTAQERSAAIVVAGDHSPDLELAIPAAYARRNFAVAVAVATAVLGPLDRDRVHSVAAGLELPGRMQLVGGDPPVILDAAHNPAGAGALAEALPEAIAARPVVACIALLADKDAAGVVRALAPRLELAVCTELPPDQLAHAGRPATRSLDAPALAEIAASAGLPTAVVPDPFAATRQAVSEARDRRGAALICGSHYLLRYAVQAPA